MILLPLNTFYGMIHTIYIQYMCKLHYALEGVLFDES